MEGMWRRVSEGVVSASSCPNVRWSSSRCAAMVGRALVLGDHAGISSNTWCAVKWPAWEAILGPFRVELDFGPKTKFAHS